MTGLKGVLLSPKEIVTLVVNAEAPSRASRTHEGKLGLCDTILGSEVGLLEERILGDLRNLVQLEPGDLCGNEREEDEEGGEVLHGERMSRGASERRGCATCDLKRKCRRDEVEPCAHH